MYWKILVFGKFLFCLCFELLRLQKLRFWMTSQARHSFGKLKLSSSQTLLITPCPSSRGRMSYISNFQEFTFLLLKRTLRNKQCLLYAKLGCARLQLQASSHCTRWHELCDDENSCKWEQNVNLFIFCRVQPNLETFKALAFQNYSKRVNGSLLTFTTSAA